VITLNLPLIVVSPGLDELRKNVHMRAGLRFLTGRRFLGYVETYSANYRSNRRENLPLQNIDPKTYPTTKGD
jgi:hypothetical protein